jgi:hypothetical protein
VHEYQQANSSSASIVSVIYLVGLKNEGRDGGRLVWYALRMLCSALPSKNFSVVRTAWVACTCSGESTETLPSRAECYLIGTCCAVPLHEPSRNDQSQINHYREQTPSKLTQTIPEIHPE